VLRRVVKDHSDIKNVLMMRTNVSVWILKESAVIRDRSALLPRRSRMRRAGSA
jgi:hypothetical protein